MDRLYIFLTQRKIKRTNCVESYINWFIYMDCIIQTSPNNFPMDSTQPFIFGIKSYYFTSSKYICNWRSTCSKTSFGFFIYVSNDIPLISHLMCFGFFFWLTPPINLTHCQILGFWFPWTLWCFHSLWKQ